MTFREYFVSIRYGRNMGPLIHQQKESFHLESYLRIFHSVGKEVAEFFQICRLCANYCCRLMKKAKNFFKSVT